MATLEGIPAILYTALWHVREMGLLKGMLETLQIKKLSVLLFFEDYKPGGKLVIDGVKGDYEVMQIDDLDDNSLRQIPPDCMITGKLKPIIIGIEKERPLFLYLFWLMLKREVRVKGFGTLLKLAKLLGRCGISV